MTTDIDSLHDAELSAAYAVEIGGWTRCEGKFEWDDGSGCPTVDDPEFATDANAVMPAIEKQFVARSHHGTCEGMTPWIVEVQPKADSRCLFVGHGPTFARAACIALLKAKRATTSR